MLPPVMQPPIAAAGLDPSQWLPSIRWTFKWTPAYRDEHKTHHGDGGHRWWIQIRGHQTSEEEDHLTAGASVRLLLSLEISTQGPGTLKMHNEKELGKVQGSETSYKSKKEKK